jgi:zinc ribbon protein
MLGSNASCGARAARRTEGSSCGWVYLPTSILPLVAGVVRIVLGVLFLLGGLFFLITIIGFFIGILGIVIGVVLLASGASARGDSRRIEEQQRQTNFLLQQQMQLAAMQGNPPAYSPGYPPAYVAAPPPPYAAPPAPAPTADRYCPVCGAGNARTAGFCQKCGKPLPPPP